MQWCLKTLSKFFAEQGISFSLDKLFELISEYGSSLVEGFVEWIGSYDPVGIILSLLFKLTTRYVICDVSIMTTSLLCVCVMFIE